MAEVVQGLRKSQKKGREKGEGGRGNNNGHFPPPASQFKVVVVSNNRRVEKDVDTREDGLAKIAALADRGIHGELVEVQPRRHVWDNYEYLLPPDVVVHRPYRQLTLEDPKWKLIVIAKRKRHIYFPLSWERAKQKREEAIAKGFKAAVVHRLWGNFEPKGEGELGQLWCGYCRSWRWFRVDQDDPIYGPREIPSCSWCGISVINYWVVYWNGDQINRKQRSRASIRRRRNRLYKRT